MAYSELELGAAVLATSASVSAVTTGWTDVAGLSVPITVPANGRMYAELYAIFTSSVAAVVASFALFDVTAGALAIGANGNTCGTFSEQAVNSAKQYEVNAKWRLQPAVGPRTYKIQCKVTATSTIAVLGEDFGAESALYLTAR